MKATIQAKKGLQTLNLNRRRAIREKCLNCSCWSNKEVEKCVFNPEYPKACSLWPYRMGTGKQNAKARDKAIKSYCVWCMAGSRAEVGRCVSPYCPLFNFRLTSAPRKAHLALREARACHSGNDLPSVKG